MSDEEKKEKKTGKKILPEKDRVNALDILAMIIQDEKERRTREQTGQKKDPLDPELRKLKLKECRDLLDSITDSGVDNERNEPENNPEKD